MNQTLLGVIIGGVIAIIPTMVQIVVTIILNKSDKKYKKQENYEAEKVKAYKKLLNYININYNEEKDERSFDFYYYDVLPYTSEELKSLVDKYFLIYFDTATYMKKHNNKYHYRTEAQYKGIIVHDINEQIRKEFQNGI